METQALHDVFGDHAHQLCISSTKSMIGHSLGAAAGIEAVVTALSIDEGVVHPTINQEEPDPDCDLDYVPEESREVDIDVALSNSFGFGGHNSCLALGKLD
jgi:3-oxoacyl-[acyl-carrier-protein] synthase II